MSALRVVWSDGSRTTSWDSLDDEPPILPFHQARADIASTANPVIRRARALFENRTCPSCNYPVVIPIELENGIRNRNGMVIPGTATLVGFRCRGCSHEWSV